MREGPRQAAAEALVEVLVHFGRRTMESAGQVRARLNDTLADESQNCRAEIDALVVAVDEGVVADLLTGRTAIDELTRRLETWGMQPETAAWCVQTWGSALGSTGPSSGMDNRQTEPAPTMAPHPATPVAATALPPTTLPPEATRAAVPATSLPPVSDDRRHHERLNKSRKIQQIAAGATALLVVAIGTSVLALQSRGVSTDAGPRDTASATPSGLQSTGPVPTFSSSQSPDGLDDPSMSTAPTPTKSGSPSASNSPKKRSSPAPSSTRTSRKPVPSPTKSSVKDKAPYRNSDYPLTMEARFEGTYTSYLIYLADNEWKDPEGLGWVISGGAASYGRVDAVYCKEGGTHLCVRYTPDNDDVTFDVITYYVQDPAGNTSTTANIEITIVR